MTALDVRSLRRCPDCGAPPDAHEEIRHPERRPVTQHACRWTQRLLNGTPDEPRHLDVGRVDLLTADLSGFDHVHDKVGICLKNRSGPPCPPPKLDRLGNPVILGDDDLDNAYVVGLKAAQAVFDLMWASDDWDGQVSTGFAATFDQQIGRMIEKAEKKP